MEETNEQPPQASRALAIKAWSDAATAILKALLFAGSIALAGILIIVTIYRHFDPRVLVVEVGPNVDETLRSLGADIDLKPALLDALNDRVTAVRQIVSLRGLNFASGSAEDAVSLRPFHLDGTTDDVARIVNLVLDRPPRPTVHIDVHCGATDCLKSDAGVARLIISLPASDGYRLISYPLERGERTAIRSVKLAVDKAADLVLERYEPLPASVWFLNRPNAMAAFADQLNPDLIRAEGAAVRSRKLQEAGCLPDLVIGMSLINRGEFAPGISAEQRAAHGRQLVCKIQAETNLVFGLVMVGMCNADPVVRQNATREVERAQARLDQLRIKRGQVEDLHYFRIPASQLAVGIMHVLQKVGPACLLFRAPPESPPRATAAELQALLREAESAMPPGVQPQARHAALTIVADAMRAAVPANDTAGRLRLAKELLDVIRTDQNRESAPRALFMLEGRLAVEVARAANDALIARSENSADMMDLVHALDPDNDNPRASPKQRIRQLYERTELSAAVAFENALGTEGLPILVEPFSDIVAVTNLADTHAVMGRRDAAASDYERAAEMFGEMEEPVAEVGHLVGAMSRWAALRMDAADCAHADSGTGDHWEASWEHLGLTAPDICEWQRSPHAVPASVSASAIIRMIREDITACYNPVKAADQTDEQRIKRLLDMQDCLDQWGLNYPIFKYSSADVDREISASMSHHNFKEPAVSGSK